MKNLAYLAPILMPFVLLAQFRMLVYVAGLDWDNAIIAQQLTFLSGVIGLVAGLVILVDTAPWEKGRWK